MRFERKTALVAGGTGGLGKSVARALAVEGATTIVTYRNRAEFEALRSAAANHPIEGHQVDVTDEAAVRKVVDEILAKYERIDYLVNAIGGYAGGIKVWEMESATLERMYDLNLRSGYVLARAVVPGMLRQHRGAIVSVGSKSAVDHAAGASAYASSKAGSLAMMDSLAEDLRGTGVRVNSVLPSIIDTEANRGAMPGADFSKWPKPEDIAKVILFLLSDDARVVHGAAVPVYGAL